MQKIMIIRHAEKHQHGLGRGVSEDGRPSPHELTVKGWQRAAALVRLFTPAGATARDFPIQTPQTIFASDATKDSPSLRAMHTAKPLADALGLRINHDYAEGEEEGLATIATRAPSPVLIVWHHGHIYRLVKAIAGDHIACPGIWPDDRFDLVWILERHNKSGGNWNFTQHAQCLFPDDCPDVIS